MKRQFVSSISGMKKIVIALLIIMAASCQKSGDYLTDGSLYGKWELRIFSGGIAGSTYNYPAGNGNTMTFKLNKSVSTTTVSPNGTTTQNGTYRTTSEVINGKRQNYMYIKTGTNPETQYDLTLKKDSFSIYPTNWADAFGSLWVKQ